MNCRFWSFDELMSRQESRRRDRRQPAQFVLNCANKPKNDFELIANFCPKKNSFASFN